MTNASLNWLNLFVSDMQTGFGPFVAVRLTAAGWDPGMIGSALSVATIAAMLAQVPAGALCDATTSKRAIAAGAILSAMASLLMLANVSGFAAVVAAEILQGAAGVVLTLAIAGITLNLSSQDKLGERLGSNLRFAALGGAAGAALLGIVGERISHMAVFYMAAAFGLPALVALRAIRPAELAQAPLRTGHRTVRPKRIRGKERTRRALLRDPRLLILLACVVLFHLANAALMPLAASGLERQHGKVADLMVSAAIIIPQLITAAASPWVGRAAQRRGRHALLVVGFAMLPLRAALFCIDGSPELIIAAQVLDGVTSATFGVLVPLMVADITHEGGRFNFALGMVGLATGIGATVSNAAAGLVAAHWGPQIAFIALGGAGALATLLAWFGMPETKHLPAAPPLTAADLIYP